MIIAIAWAIALSIILVFMTVGMIIEHVSIGSILGMWILVLPIIAALAGAVIDEEEKDGSA